MRDGAIADGVTISDAKNRDTVLGGCPAGEPCYLELVQPGKLAVRVTHLTPRVPKACMPHQVQYCTPDKCVTCR